MEDSNDFKKRIQTDLEHKYENLSPLQEVIFMPYYYSAFYKLLTSKEYIQFTDLVFSTIGSEIEKFFPDIQTELIYRIKSPKSFNNKSSAHQEEKIKDRDSSKTKIFDTYGMKLVVSNVPPDSQLSQTILSDNEDLELDYLVSKYIFEYVLENSKKLERLGITQIPSRRKSFNKDNGYKAEHYGLCCKYLPHWCAEFQTKSKFRDDIATFGSASHELGTNSEKDISEAVDQRYLNKIRKLPKISSIQNKSNNEHELNKFINNDILSCIPKFSIYVKDGKIKKYSDRDNFFYFYHKQFKELQEIENENQNNKGFSKIKFYDDLFDKTSFTYKPDFEQILNTLDIDEFER